VIVLRADNVHDALPTAVGIIKNCGILRESRNGPVLQSPSPVATVYKHPEERVIFWPERDANPFFHLYESLWMLAGRDDVESVARYSSHIREYSDDGKTFHGAYGRRWRSWGWGQNRDQIAMAVDQLRADHDDRRVVLGMWNPAVDLGRRGKDLPCNLTITLQINEQDSLDMVVFCRSNDIVWGAYGANAVHFSMLQEFVARCVGVSVGTYTQVSVNWHAYLNRPFEKVKDLYEKEGQLSPYRTFAAKTLMPGADEVVGSLYNVLGAADMSEWSYAPRNKWERVVLNVLHAHEVWSTKAAPERFAQSLAVLNSDLDDLNADWNIAAREWIERRQVSWERKMENQA